MAIVGRSASGQFISKVRAHIRANTAPAELAPILAAEKAQAREILANRRGEKGRAENWERTLERTREKHPNLFPDNAFSIEAGGRIPETYIREIKERWDTKSVWSDPAKGPDLWYWYRMNGQVALLVKDAGMGPEEALSRTIAHAARKVKKGSITESPLPFDTDYVEYPEDFDEFYEFSAGKIRF